MLSIHSNQDACRFRPVLVRCIDTGEKFSSVRKCGQHFNIDDEVIRRALRYSNGYVKKYHLIFEFI